MSSEASTSASPTAYTPPRPIPPTTPPKGILKRPPPPPKSFFSLGFTKDIISGSISKFLPPATTPNASTAALRGSATLSPGQNGSAEGTPDRETAAPSPLKRAHFLLPHLTTTYPISSQAPPSSLALTTAKLEIEEKEKEKREKEKEEGASAWSMARVEEFYRECCRQQEEPVLGGVVGAFRQANLIPPRTLDLTSVKLSASATIALADVLAIEWGLRKLILADCDLDDLSIKCVLHSLLISNALQHLSIASNKRMKPPGIKYVAVYIRQARCLHFLDLSQIPLEKRAIEHLISSFTIAPPMSPSTSPAATPSIGSPRPSSPVGDDSTEASPSPPKPHTPHKPTWEPRTPPPSSPSTQSVSLISTLSTLSTPAASSSTSLPESSSTSRPTPTIITTSPLSPAPAAESSNIHSISNALSKVYKSLPESKLTTLKLDDCSLRSGSLEVLAHAVRPSALQNLSLRSNKIGPTGAVALALMIKDYPDSVPLGITPTSTASAPSSPVPPSSPLSFSTPLSPQPTRASTFQPLSPGKPPPPPPRHPSVLPQPPAQTTYTPYIPRARRNMVPPPAPANIPQPPSNVPVITSSRAGGITTRHPPPAAPHKPPNGKAADGIPNRLEGHSAALLDKVRSLDALPRIGALQTLDLKGNEIRGGVSYIAQVLKRNRTLKVLNLADNRIDVQGLVVIAEALKYNSNLETLDMSGNPCCGPGLEGVTSIRTALTINAVLKRLFLSNTSLTSSGAIALAEFLPEARKLLHLDLTGNSLDLAGVMALSVGLKMNQVMRCLDVNVPPNDVEMARLSREILRSCVRNTERVAGVTITGEPLPPDYGEGSSSLSEGLDGILGAGARGGVWGLIERSELARVVKQDVERERVGEEKRELQSLGGKQKLDVWRKTPSEVVKASRQLLHDAHEAGPENVETLLERSHALVGVLVEMVQVEKEPERLEELLSLNDQLTSLVKNLKSGEAPYGLTPEETLASPTKDYKGKGKAKERPTIDFPLNPAFSIGDSDDEEDPSGRGRAGADDGDSDGQGDVEEFRKRFGPSSPTDLSRSWVAEEGEVFRKGTVLLGPDEMEEGGETTEISGEDLKRELLEAQVERPRRNVDLDSEIEAQRRREEEEGPHSPRSPRSRSSTIDIP